MVISYIQVSHVSFDQHEQMVQATSERLKVTKPRSPPSTSSCDSEGFMGRNVKYRDSRNRNLTVALGNALVNLTPAPHQLSEEENIIQQLLVLIHRHLIQSIHHHRALKKYHRYKHLPALNYQAQQVALKQPIKILNVNMIVKSYSNMYIHMIQD